MEVTQEPIIRTYAGAGSAEVEEEYRADATQAAQAGYMPISYEWLRTGEGLALKVGYRLGGSGPGVEAQPTELARAEAEPARAEAPAPVEEFAPQPESAAPAIVAQARGPETGTMPAEPGLTVEAADEPVAYAPPPDIEIPAELGRYAPPPSVDEEPVPQAVAAPIAEAPVAEPLTAAPAPVEAPAAEQAPPESVAPSTTGRQARLKLTVLDMHCAGEPLRLVRSGFPDVPSMPAAERRIWAIEHADDARRALIAEPRGHRDMYGALLLPPFTEHADHCVLFMHNDGWSTMCGHGIIAVTTALIEEGLHPASGPVTTIRYETPAGIVAANAATRQANDGDWTVQGVRFTNVPAYVAERSITIRPDGLELPGGTAGSGSLKVDLAFGGAFYGIVDAASLGLRVVPEQVDELRRAGAAVTDLLRRDHTPVHPADSSLGFVYGTIIVDRQPQASPDGRAPAANLRNATVFANAQLDRSPCGSGTSALLAQLHADGRLAVGQQIVSAGITGEYFLGRIEAEARVGPYAAVSTSIQGTAFVTGYSTLIVDSRDPLAEGFLLGR